MRVAQFSACQQMTAFTCTDPGGLSLVSPARVTRERKSLRSRDRAGNGAHRLQGWRQDNMRQPRPSLATNGQTNWKEDNSAGMPLQRSSAFSPDNAR